MSSPVASVMIEPAYETSVRKCERCPTRYLEVKRIGEEGYRLCCACWWELASETVTYGMDAFQRYANAEAIKHMEEKQENYSPTLAEIESMAEAAGYARQVAENKLAKRI